MAVRDILLLGDPKLYEVCAELRREELDTLPGIVTDLHDTMMDFRERHGAGRAIAAPQIGVMKRIVYMNIDAPVVFVNPVIDEKSDERITLWDDCMSFPNLLVRVERHRRCRVAWRDEHWEPHTRHLHDDLSELLQHECDHLDGILAVSRAIDSRSFKWRR